MPSVKIGIIGGSGLYHMTDLANPQEQIIDTPYGAPSDAIITGTVHGTEVAFLARHGRGHGLIPSEVPYCANIYAMKMLGVKHLISFSAVGSLHESMRPLDMVIPDQYIDLTKKRDSTFFGAGAVAHVSMAQPVCENLAATLARAVEQSQPSINLHRGGTYVCIEGPQFSSLAESNWYRSMGAKIIGMTNMPEAKLAKEAQMAYASLAMVTDFDCWHPKEDNVSANSALANLMQNAEKAQAIARKVIHLIATENPGSSFHTALSQALVTPADAMTPIWMEKISMLLK